MGGYDADWVCGRFPAAIPCKTTLQPYLFSCFQLSLQNIEKLRFPYPEFSQVSGAIVAPQHRNSTGDVANEAASNESRTPDLTETFRIRGQGVRQSDLHTQVHPNCITRNHVNKEPNQYGNVQKKVASTQLPKGSTSYGFGYSFIEFCTKWVPVLRNCVGKPTS